MQAKYCIKYHTNIHRLESKFTPAGGAKAHGTAHGVAQNQAYPQGGYPQPGAYPQPGYG